MKYENRKEVELILNGIAKTEKKLNTTMAIRNSINSRASIELSASSVGLTIRVSLTDAQVKSITDDIIKECNKELDKYKEQLKDL